jgi:hypothetical protein
MKWGRAPLPERAGDLCHPLVSFGSLPHGSLGRDPSPLDHWVVAEERLLVDLQQQPPYSLDFS